MSYVKVPLSTSPLTAVSLWVTIGSRGTGIHLQRGPLSRDGFKSELRTYRHFPPLDVGVASDHLPVLYRSLAVLLLEASEHLIGAPEEA